MTRDTLHNVRQSASESRLRTSLLAVGLCVLLALSLAPASPVAAQTDGDIPQCDEGPPIPGQEEGSGQEAEIVFVNDHSSSMSTETDSGETRLDLLKDAVGEFIRDANDADELADVSINSNLRQALTTDHEAVNASVQSLETPSGSQLEGDAINTSTDELTTGTNATDGANKVIIFVTDGGPNNAAAGLDAADDARSAGITIFTVGIGDSVNDTFMVGMAGDESRYYENPESAELTDVYDAIQEDIEEIERGLTIETRSLFQPGETHEYTVTNTTVREDGTVETEDVTGDASVNTSNASLLTADEQAAELTATNDADAAAGVVITAEHGNATGCVNAIVAQASMANLELLPTTWRITTFLGNWTTFLLLISIGAGIIGTRAATSFLGLGMMELVLITGWFGGYISRGLMLVSVFAALFIGLNLAANIDYQVQR